MPNDEKKHYQKLIEAQSKIVEALESLESDERKRVLDAALTLLGVEPGLITPEQRQPESKDVSLEDKSPEEPPPVQPTPIKDIRTLRKEKQPSTDIEMVCLVAYYLSKLAGDDERKEVMTPEDINKYFEQAGHPLPKVPSQTLRNTKNAGYLDNVGEAKFKLNAVGYNLVVHNLPRTESESKKVTTKRKARTTKKAAQNRKTRNSKKKTPRKKLEKTKRKVKS